MPTLMCPKWVVLLVGCPSFQCTWVPNKLRQVLIIGNILSFLHITYSQLHIYTQDPQFYSGNNMISGVPVLAFHEKYTFQQTATVLDHRKRYGRGIT